LSSLLCSSSVFLDFDFCFFLNQTNTVRVSNVSPKATEHDIQDFFSFSGEIEHIELHK
jgi:RNA recognition motif-containing protein